MKTYNKLLHFSVIAIIKNKQQKKKKEEIINFAGSKMKISLNCRFNRINFQI